MDFVLIHTTIYNSSRGLRKTHPTFRARFANGTDRIHSTNTKTGKNTFGSKQ